MRVLRALRLSREREESTSFPRQRQDIDPVVTELGGTVVATAEDMDVSAGTVAPMERPGLGPWLTDPELISQYDAIAWAKLDRAIRNMMDLNDLAKFAVTHKKELIFCSGPGGKLTFNFRRRDPVNDIILQFLAFAAELEWLAISDRNKSTSDYLRSHGRYRGGPIPYGFMKAKNPNGDGWVLIHDPDAVKVIQEAVRRASEGEVAQSICDDFTKRGILTPKQHERLRAGKEIQKTRNGKPIVWQAVSLFNCILRSRALLGETESFVYDDKGKMVRGEDGKKLRNVLRGADGMPVARAKPIVTHAEWTKLQQALDERAMPYAARRKDANRLLGVAKCIVCDANLYLKEWIARDRVQGYFYCSARCTKSTRAEVLDELLGKILLQKFGHLEIYSKQFVPGEDYSEELARVNESINGIREEHDLGLYEGNRQGYLDRLKKLVDRKSVLEGMPSRPASWEYIPSGVTYRSAWESAEPAERRKLLLDAGVAAYVGNPKDEQTKDELLSGLTKRWPNTRATVDLHSPIALAVFYSEDIEKRLTGNAEAPSTWSS